MTATNLRQRDLAAILEEVGATSQNAALKTIQGLAAQGFLPRPGHGRPAYLTTEQIARVMLGIAVAMANRGQVGRAGDYFAMRPATGGRRLDEDVAGLFEDLVDNCDTAAEAQHHSITVVGGGGLGAHWETPHGQTYLYVPEDRDRAAIPPLCAMGWLLGEALLEVADRVKPLQRLNDGEVAYWGSYVQQGGSMAQVGRKMLGERAEESAAAKPAGASRDPDQVTPRPIQGRAS